MILHDFTWQLIHIFTLTTVSDRCSDSSAPASLRAKTR